MEDFLEHHGILGQKWGVTHGPPYPIKKSLVNVLRKRSEKSKKQGQYTIRKNQKIQTLSVDKTRMKSGTFFYAAVTPKDRLFYKAFFSEPFSKLTKRPPKYTITATAAKNLKIANEVEGTKAFARLYKKSPGFRKYILSPDGMNAEVDKKKRSYKEYKHALDTLKTVQDGEKPPTNEQFRDLFILYNLTYPATRSSVRSRYRNLFTKELEARGFDGFLDTNDALYGKFKRDVPVIITNTSAIEPLSAVLGFDSGTTLDDVKRILERKER